MGPLQHTVISALVFGFLYLIGFSENFVLLAFLASILVDIDHFVIGRYIGTYNPMKIYRSCRVTKEINLIFTPKDLLLKRWFDFRVTPFHNLFLNAILLIFIFPVGVGVLLHNIVDMLDYVISNILGEKSSIKKPRPGIKI